MHRNNILEKILNKIEKIKKKKILFVLALIFVPFILLIDKNGKDKSGLVLSGLFVVDLILFLGILIFSRRLNGICLIAYFAINLWGWLMYAMSKNDAFLK